MVKFQDGGLRPVVNGKKVSGSWWEYQEWADKNSSVCLQKDINMLGSKSQPKSESDWAKISSGRSDGPMQVEVENDVACQIIS